jgi:hypothetical protein
MRWLRANDHDLGPLTGTDTRALLAIAACWRLYFSSDAADHVVRAVVELLRSMQPKCWRFAKALIPWAGDWSHEEPTWARVLELVLGPLCRCTAHGSCPTRIDDAHASGLCYACRKKCAS